MNNIRPPLLDYKQIKAIRLKLGWTVGEMADALGLHGPNAQTMVRQFERTPKSKSHRQITGPAAVSIMSFVDGFDPPPPDEWAGIIDDFLAEKE